MPYKTHDWYGLYRERWTDDCIPAAYAHPAKFARGLIRAIYRHLLAEGYIEPGDTILDPFAGVCLGALDAMRLGLRWWGNELEPRFVDVGRGLDCPGFTRVTWRRLQRRIGRVNHTHDLRFCPDCVKAMADIGESRLIPCRQPHHFEGNLDLWDRKYKPLWPDTWGSAVMTQGDSRELGKMLVQWADGSVSSPPYAASVSQHNQANDAKARIERKATAGLDVDQALIRSGPNSQQNQPQRYSEDPANLGNMPASDQGLEPVVTSPPFGEGETRDRSPVQDGHVADCITRAYTQDKQGTTPGNLATMDATISSPPYSQTLKGGEGPGARYDFKTHSPENAVKQTCDPDYGGSDGQLANMKEGDVGAVVSSPPYAAGCAHTGGETKMTSGQGGPIKFVEYGKSEGQLGTMREGDHDAVVSSPPWEKGAEGALRKGKFRDPEAFASQMSSKDGAGTRNATTPASRLAQMERDSSKVYGDSPGQMGQTEADDFWTAARTIVDQCYLLLKPGAVAVWVVKRFVRNKQIVDFPDQWRQMCEAAGFETVEWIRAWVVEEHGGQMDLWGENHTRKVERKSFFRRLYESKHPENSIDWEDVLIMRKLSQGA